MRDLDKHPNNRKHERRKTNKQNKNTRYKNDNNIFFVLFPTILVDKKGKWYTSDGGNTFHLYSGFSDATSKPREHKMSIFGLQLSYNEKEGSLFLDERDYKSSKKVFPSLSPVMKRVPLARVESIN